MKLMESLQEVGKLGRALMKSWNSAPSSAPSRDNLVLRQSGVRQSGERHPTGDCLPQTVQKWLSEVTQLKGTGIWVRVGPEEKWCVWIVPSFHLWSGLGGEVQLDRAAGPEMTEPHREREREQTDAVSSPGSVKQRV